MRWLIEGEKFLGVFKRQKIFGFVLKEEIFLKNSVKKNQRKRIHVGKNERENRKRKGR